MAGKTRVRQWGIDPGRLVPGPLNAITDVQGVGVGHCTVMQGEAVRTGVTAVLPHFGNLFRNKVPAAVEVINGFGKAVGLSQIQELGELETPVILTNTLSTGVALDALIEYKLERNKEIGKTSPSVNGVVAECNDGYLHDIRGKHVKKDHVLLALGAAGNELSPEGSVGAGTGMKSFDCKSGIGTSSRQAGEYLVGVLVLSNFGKWRQLKITGVPVGELLRKPRPGPGTGCDNDTGEEGSIVIIVATDAPLNSRQLQRIARRSGFGLARTGSIAGNHSGDFSIAFSTGVQSSQAVDGLLAASFLLDGRMDVLFEAAVEATEEAILNALFASEGMTGRDGNSVPGLPVEDILEVVR